MRIHTDEGISGVGEAPILPLHMESQSSCESAIREELAPAVLNEDPFSIERIAEKMDTIPGREFSKAAIESALWDIVGKSVNVPIHKLLGGPCRDRLPVVGHVTIDRPEEMAKEATNYVNAGHRVIKVKGAAGIEEDVENVSAVREAIGPEIGLRLDLEGFYRPKQAIRLIKKLERYELELISQPAQPSDLDGMALVRRSVDTVILADECISSPLDVLRVIRKEAADAINIHVLKVGGIRSARIMAGLAETAGLPVIVGSMVELSPGTLASAHFAVCTRMAGIYDTELIGPLKLDGDIVKEPVSIVNGCLQVPTRPGLGVELDDSKVDAYRTKR